MEEVDNLSNNDNNELQKGSECNNVVDNDNDVHDPVNGIKGDGLCVDLDELDSSSQNSDELYEILQKGAWVVKYVLPIYIC